MLKTPISPLTSARVRQEVDALPAKERAAVMLICVKGLSYQDAAQKLGIPHDAVTGHLLRGRLTLIRNLDLKCAVDRGTD
jgi:RNA polymerase sigma-70 factor (ECF subfamily)